jgi:uncharacterized protein
VPVHSAAAIDVHVHRRGDRRMLGLAIMVSAWTGLPFSQAYLATTPGGIYAVLATAMDSGAGPIVVTMQVFRMPVMVLCAVIGSKLLNRRLDR